MPRQHVLDRNSDDMNSKALKAKAVLYVRVSTSEQVNNYSLDTQERACREYCEREGIQVERVFREEGESAKTVNRTQLQEMINFCVENARRLGIGFVVVYRVDRLARKVLDHTMIRASLSRLGIQVRAVQEAFDESASGKLVENLMAALAQFDNDARAARTIDGMKAGLSRGRWMWQAPIGYLKVNVGRSSPSLVLDPVAGPLVRMAFESVATRAGSVTDVLEAVTSLGLQTKRGKTLSLQSFGTLLRNPLYAGRISVPKWDFEGLGDFEPLVNAELFARVQSVLNARAKGERRHLDHPDFPLRRLVRCGRCEAPLTGSWSKGRTRRYAYYRCPRRGCSGVSVRKADLELMLASELERLAARVEVFGLLGDVVRDAWQERNRSVRAERARFERELIEIEKRKNRLVDAYVQEGAIDRPTFEQQSRRLDEEASAATERMAKPLPNDRELDQTIEFAIWLLEDLVGCWNRLDWRRRPDFLRVLFPDGLVYSDGAIGTAQTSWIVDDFAALRAHENDMAPPTGFEPVFPP